MPLSELLGDTELRLRDRWMAAAAHQCSRLAQLLEDETVFARMTGLLTALIEVIRESESADQVTRAVDQTLQPILDHLRSLQEKSELNATEVVFLLYTAKQSLTMTLRERLRVRPASRDAFLEVAELDQVILLLNRLGIVFFEAAMRSREDFALQHDVLAIEYALLYERTRQIAITDSLTGLYNYGYFLDRLREERARAERYQRLLSLVLLDIDHFKHYNDHNGHPAGNEVLKRIGRILEEEAREVDIVARYGGEEFVLLVPEANRRSAFSLAERVRDRVADTLFPHRETQLSGALTVSAGVATYPIDASDEEALVRAADQSLYRAKTLGRNCVAAYEPADKVTLVFSPPPAVERVALVGTFNNWDRRANPMAAQGDGSFRFELALSPGTYRFKYVLDGKDWIADTTHESEPDNYGGQNNVLRVRRDAG